MCCGHVLDLSLAPIVVVVVVESAAAAAGFALTTVPGSVDVLLIRTGLSEADVSHGTRPIRS